MNIAIVRALWQLLLHHMHACVVFSIKVSRRLLISVPFLFEGVALCTLALLCCDRHSACRLLTTDILQMMGSCDRISRG